MPPPVEAGGRHAEDPMARPSDMPYSLKILWREPRRYLPAVLAVAFSDLLITVQVGLLLGALSVLSLPIDHSDAEVWVASPEVLSIELGYPIPESWRSRLASHARGRGHGALPLRVQLLAQAAGGLGGLLRDRVAAGARAPWASSAT